MKICYGKELESSQINLINTLAVECNILFDTAKLLYYRGIDTVSKAKRFLSPSKDNFNNPFLLNGMSEACSRIKDAIKNNKNLLVFGDYDVDGICSATVLTNVLKELNANVKTIVPEREDGYGLNYDTVMNIHNDFHVDLLLTVDCGISDYETIEKLKEQGIEVIVTDHHEPPELLPNCICINPKIKGQEFPFDGLCGTGVAYKLSYALIGERANEYLDYVALATVADSMDLVEENRDIVFEGLKIFNSGKIRKCFKYMLGNNAKTINSQTLAYQIAPKINAGGRMGDANCVLKLFASQKESEIIALATLLTEYNVARQGECDVIYREAKKKIIEQELYLDKVILVYDENWKTGFIGIVAARLVEEYSKPVIVFAGVDGFLKGSARSLEGINIFNAIVNAKDLLIGFGGHSQAAGVSVSKENFDSLRQSMNKYFELNGGEDFENATAEKVVEACWDIDKPISMRFAREIEMLEPFGVGNKKPSFTTAVESVVSSPLKCGSIHYLFRSEVFEFLDFNGEKDVFNLSLPIKKTVVFDLSYSVFRGNESVRGIVKEIICDFTDKNQLNLFAFRNEIIKLKNIDEFDYGRYVDFNKEIEKGYGTLYLLYDAKNVPTNPPVNVYYFKCESKCAENCIVVSPSEIPNEYKKIVRLDLPILSVKDVKSGNESEYRYLKELDVERSSFAQVYNILCGMVNKRFTDSVNCFNNNKLVISPYQFIFACEVFFELGFFTVNNGYLKRDNTVKSPLTNSKIYGIIEKIKRGNN